MTVKLIANFDGPANPLKFQPHSELLQSPLWGKVQEAGGRSVFYLGMFDENKLTKPPAGNSVPFQHPRAACLIIKHKLPLGKSWLYSPRFNWPANYVLQLISEIAKIAKKEKAIFWKFESIDELRIANCEFIKSQTINPQSAIRNWTIYKSMPLQPPETFIIDLTVAEDQLLKNMKPKTRYNIRVAQKKAVRVRWSNGAADINAFYNLLTATARRQKIKIHPKRHYQNILKILGNKDAAALAIAEINPYSKPIAANLITFFGNTATYLHGGSSDAHRFTMAPHLLQWEAIKEAKRRGCKFYDMGGCAVKTGKIDKWAGITRFKAGFGGELKQFGPTYDVVFNRPWYQSFLIVRKLL